MQPLTAAPRTALTAAQVTALLVAPDMTVGFGVELLDANLALVADISADVATGIVHRDNTAAVHGTLDLTVTRALAWGKDRVRPFMLLSSATAGVTSVRFNLGVYLLTTPATPLAEAPITYTVTGFDQLYLLLAPVGDSYSAAAGSNVLAAIRSALTSAGVTAPVLLDASASAAVLSSDLTLPLTSSSSPTWIQVVAKLTAAINYQPVWFDWDGACRSGPFVTPANRSPEYTFLVGDVKVGIIAAARTVANDVWGVPNEWIFIQNGLTSPPATGAGRYVVNNVSTGLSSQTSIGRTIPAPVQFLDAVGQASLQAQGDAIVAAAMQSAEVITVKVSPFPIAWHVDVVGYSDPALGADRKAVCQTWSLPLDGSDGDYVMDTVS